MIVPNLNVNLPSPLPLSVDVACADVDPGLRNVESLVDIDKYSNFQKIVRIHMKVLTFVSNLKSCLKNKDPDRYAHFDCYDRDLFLEANRQVIESNQRRYFPEVYHYFESKQKLQKDIPNIVQQLNVFMDNHGILRVRSKVSKLKDDSFVNFPMLLHKKSRLTQLIIMDMHCKFCHAGVYSLLSEMRKRFWIPHYFSAVKRVLKSCVICRRFKERTIKLNQSPYRDFRVDPPQIPFRYAFVDHLGPFNVKLEGKNRKVWLLCVSCLWSRAVNLKLCMDLTTKEFLHCFQLHCFDYGVPQLVLSDLGSQIVAGANVITDFLNDHKVQNYFKENDAKLIKFEQYFKGCNKLGGLVETCVKSTKRLIYGAIRKNVLNLRDFEFIIEQTKHLINRRPIAFQEGLRDDLNNPVPDPITPEMLIHGRSLLSLNLIPDLQDVPLDLDWIPSNDSVGAVVDSYKKLRNVRTRLNDLYHSEFLSHLVSQATDSKTRYKPVNHKRLSVGDVVLLKEPNTKPSNYPMGIVKSVVINDLGEVTGAAILKGRSREIVKRHVTSLIPLLSSDQPDQSASDQVNQIISRGNFDHTGQVPGRSTTKRKAALVSAEKTKHILSS